MVFVWSWWFLKKNKKKNLWIHKYGLINENIRYMIMVISLIWNTGLIRMHILFNKNIFVYLNTNNFCLLFNRNIRDKVSIYNRSAVEILSFLWSFMKLKPKGALCNTNYYYKKYFLCQNLTRHTAGVGGLLRQLSSLTGQAEIVLFFFWP